MPHKEVGIQPHVIHATAVYSVEMAQAALSLKASTIRREVREGRLRIAKRSGRYFLLGSWLLEWIEAGEMKRKKTVHLNGQLEN